ncbi:MAG: pilus assembly protein PilM [Desulfobacterota bacterium]|nr:pilus assembly protein PilM [Thermodesulfobacteriota bacterium]
MPAAIGIDLRPRHLILTLLKRSFGRVRVVDYAIHPIAPEEDREEREAQVIGAIPPFLARHSLRRDRIHVSLPREKAIARFIRLPAATRENLRKVLEYELPKYTPFKADEVYFDYHLLREEKEWLTLFAAFVRRSEIESSLSLLKKVGIRPISIQISTVSALNHFFYNRPSSDGEASVLLELFPPFLEMNLLRGSEWEESFHFHYHPDHWPAEVIRIWERSGLRPASGQSVRWFLFGEEGEEKNLTLLKESAGQENVFRPPIDRLKWKGDRRDLGLLYPSIGAPLSGLVKPRIELNLLPEELRERRRKIGRPLLLILLCLFGLFGVRQGMTLYSQQREELASISEEVRRRKPEVEALEKIQKEKEALAKEISELEKFQSEEVSKIDILKELTSLLPETAWLWNLKYNGRELELSGYADSASDLIQIFDKSPLFEKVEFLAPVTKERFMRPDGSQEKERFRLRVRLEARRPGS